MELSILLPYHFTSFFLQFHIIPGTRYLREDVFKYSIYIYIHAYIHICIYIHIQIHPQTHRNIHIHRSTQTHIYIHIHIHIHYTYTYTYTLSQPMYLSEHLEEHHIFMVQHNFQINFAS